MPSASGYVYTNTISSAITKFGVFSNACAQSSRADSAARAHTRGVVVYVRTCVCVGYSPQLKPHHTARALARKRNSLFAHSWTSVCIVGFIFPRQLYSTTTTVMARTKVFFDITIGGGAAGRIVMEVCSMSPAPNTEISRALMTFIFFFFSLPLPMAPSTWICSYVQTSCLGLRVSVRTAEWTAPVDAI